MEVKHPSLKLRGLSPSDCNSDPEEKEGSDNDDDDCNHKHCRLETRSQSLETDCLDQVLTRPYRKCNIPFLNGHSIRDNEYQRSANWKNYNLVNAEKDFSRKLDRRRLGSTLLPRAPLDANLKNWVNQSFSVDLVSGRGRGPWNKRDSRFIDIASQMVQLGSVPPSLISRRGFPNVLYAQNASWNAFGLIPVMPYGGLDTLDSIGLEGTLKPPIHSSLNMGITRPRCRDFEESGFCLRGDMCPMEHGVNQIVVDDVQSLSQFNLPVSHPSAPLLGQSIGPGSLASINASSTTALNGKGSQSKSSKHGTGDDDLCSNGPYLACANGGDFYDPDQPLWNTNGPETSNALSLSSPIDETGALLNGDASDSEFPVRSTGNAVCSQSTVWDRIDSLKSRTDHSVNSADYPEKETMEEKEELASTCVSHRGKRIRHEDTGSKLMDSSSGTEFDTMHNVRKPSQKAMQTLFVNGIPQKSNKREALLAHFQKFGEVIDIYIPINSEQAFVQFSKREDAEAALKSPDAVMGNRFIRLWWANHDSIPDDNTNSSSNLSITPHGGTAVSVPPQSTISSSSKDNLQAPAPKRSTVRSQDASLHAFDNAKHVISNGLKVPPVQKKLDNLEQLKEQLRKKQELLEQKRNDFRRKLDKLEKQATGQKTESDTEQAAKRPKVGKAAHTTEASPQRSSDAVSGVESPHAEIDNNKAREDVVSDSPKTKKTTTVQETPCSKQQLINPFASLGAFFIMNRYKLDNRPTVFRVLPPLPAGFADVAVLKEHFLQYGDISNVELEDVEVREDSSEAETAKDCPACITFTTRRSAERAFASGKCWQSHNLKFMWLTSSNSINDRSGKENSLSISQGSLGTDVRPGEKPTCDAYKEDSSSGNKEEENGGEKNGVERMELVEDLHSYSKPNI